MPRVCERRRHTRTPVALVVVLRDRIGRILLHGRTADMSPCGIKIVGRCGDPLREGGTVWVELSVPNLRRSGPRRRRIKVRGQVRRIVPMGDWESVVVVFESDFHNAVLDPTL